MPGDWIFYVVTGLPIALVVIPVLVFVFLYWILKDVLR